MATHIELGPVVHFRLAVRDPEASATWWTENFDLVERRRVPDRILIGNDSISIGLTLGEPGPAVLGHMAFLVSDRATLESALETLKANGVDVEDPGDEIGPVAPGSQSLGLWFHDLDGYRWELFLPAP
jgi:catechol 2,3-dioxygenase-like lactoylglutathione lyase family enzyme